MRQTSSMDRNTVGARRRLAMAVWGVLGPLLTGAACAAAADGAGVQALVERYPVRQGRGVNDGVWRVFEIRFAENVPAGTQTLAVPEDVSAAAAAFAHLLFRGPDGSLENLDVTLVFADGARTSARLEPGRYRGSLYVALASALRPEAAWTALEIRSTAPLTYVALDSPTGIAVARAPAAAAAPATEWNARVEVDARVAIRLGTTTQLDRDKYFNIHDRPDWGAMPEAVLAEMRRQYQVDQARSIILLNLWGDTLREDPCRPGYVDPACYARPIDAFEDYCRTKARRPGWESIFAVGHYPDFMEVQDRAYRGTPADPAAAAALIVGLYDNMKQYCGYLPRYFEPLNEPDTPANWAWQFEPQAWPKFHAYTRAVTQALHAAHPTVQVGGPCLAWPHFGADGLPVWRRNLRDFITELGDEIDFVSLHCYDTLAERPWAAWRSGQGHFLSLGKVDAVLDLTENHCVLTGGREKPLLISEYGAFGTSAEIVTPRGMWCHLRSLNALLMRFLDRQDQLCLTVPFVLSYSVWDPGYGYSLYRRRPAANDGDAEVFEPTALSYFYRLWRDVRGHRIRVESDHRWLLSRAFLDGATVYTVLQNIGPAGCAVELTPHWPEGCRSRAQARWRLGYLDGQPALRQEDGGAAAPVRLASGEVLLLIDTLSDAIQPETIRTQRRVYGNRIEMALSERPETVEIALSDGPGSPAAAWLRIGWQRDGGFTANPTVWFNGHMVTIDLDDSRGLPNFFEPVEVSIPVGWLRQRNELRISSADGGMAAYALLRLLEP